ncbi:hypothetical protein [Mycolicibacterium fortuitum]|uniref:hypothetical protein n=1 Tax=Mycolicibacterium fortuitum TaxID=1766 RepID=UPI00262D7E37|nr:hypothetical protein [Mycolicibacterium fortuitum]
MTKDNDANQVLITAASERAHTYEMAFAKAAVAEPILADRGAPQADLLRAAALRSLVATGRRWRRRGRPRPPRMPKLKLAYQIAVPTALPDDPHFNGAFFSGGRLLSPNEIAESDWSIYDTQLTVYLTPCRASTTRSVSSAMRTT